MSTVPLRASSIAERQSARRLRSILSGSAGNFVEWYDWYVYAAFAVYFAGAFFPSGDLTARLLNTAGIFAIGFVVRPLGGWLLGWYADRHGRRAALVLSVLMMCGGSLLIAFTPGHASIGAFAPALLLVARMLQGLSVGGEYGTSATYLSEVATAERRGFFSSFQYVTLILGQLTALAVLLLLQQLLDDRQLRDWGWRIPFVIGGLCAIVVLYLRRGMRESAAFTVAIGATGRGSVRQLLKYPKEIAIVFGLTMGGTVSFYTFTTYAQKFLINTTGFDSGTATAISACALLAFMVLQPIVGLASDYTGRKPVLIAFGVLATTMTVPLLTALQDAQTPAGAFALLVGALVIVSGYTAVNAIVKAELFPTEIRALGVGLPYALAVALFGGTAEYVALWCKSRGYESGFYWYVTACAGVSLFVYLCMAETRNSTRIPDLSAREPD
jgi:MHS family alpha-ketoglutarate permease-like MFS transporter